MRNSEANNTRGRMGLRPSGALLRAMRLACVILGIAIVMGAGVARAQDDDEEDDSTFEEKIIKNLMSGLGATSMENKGIDYRERSPLVVPPKLDLPPPVSNSAGLTAPNWPKDPDEAERKAAAAERKKREFNTGIRPLTPEQMNAGRKTAARSSAVNDPAIPGNPNAGLSQEQMGNTGGLSKIFSGTAKNETAPFNGEPPRASLTQPPVGYQTPSPNFAYGVGTDKNAKFERPDVDTSGRIR